MSLKVAVYGRVFAPEHADFVQHLFDRLKRERAVVKVYEPFFDFVCPRLNIDKDLEVFTRHKEIRGEVDFMFSIGGDGTFLDSTRYVRDSRIPIIGVNTGRLGFLSSISLDEIDVAIDQIIDNRFHLDSRTLIKLETNEGFFGDNNFALNELTVLKKDTSSMITINSYVNDEFLNSYWADGLIIATTTGSTAYSLSCGGPIILPGCNDFVITPVAPHNLNVRPLVVPDTSIIKLKVEGRSQHFLAALDSRSESMDSSVELVVSKNNFHINLLRLEGYSYLSNLRNKLNWGLDKRN